MLNVSVIIPALNEEAQIAACLANAWAAEPYEVILVDGGSHDATIELARDHRTRVLESAAGRAVQQNVGAQSATGEVLLFLHADCRLPHDAVDQISRALRSDEIQHGAFRQRIMSDDWRYRWLERGNAWRATRLRLPYGDQGIFVRRDLFHQVGGFPILRLMEDVQLMASLRRKFKPVLLPGPLDVSCRRWQRHGVVRQTLRNWTLTAAWTCGVDANALARFYPAHPSEAKRRSGIEPFPVSDLSPPATGSNTSGDHLDRERTPAAH